MKDRKEDIRINSLEKGVLAKGMVWGKQRSGEGHGVLGCWSGFLSGPRVTDEARKVLQNSILPNNWH